MSATFFCATFTNVFYCLHFLRLLTFFYFHLNFYYIYEVMSCCSWTMQCGICLRRQEFTVRTARQRRRSLPIVHHPHHYSIPNSKLSYFSNPTLHRYLTPLRTDFTDTRTALRLFFCFSFFLVFSYWYFLPF